MTRVDDMYCYFSEPIYVPMLEICALLGTWFRRTPRGEVHCNVYFDVVRIKFSMHNSELLVA